MKLANANAIRARTINVIFDYFLKAGEDVGQIASNAINFPIVTDDGEEGWVEVVVKIPKEDGDEGFDKRLSYEIAVKEKAEKEKTKAEAKAKKIAKDKTKREAKERAED